LIVGAHAAWNLKLNFFKKRVPKPIKVKTKKDGYEPSFLVDQNIAKLIDL
jgi:hypothetical protein